MQTHAPAARARVRWRRPQIALDPASFEIADKWFTATHKASNVTSTTFYFWHDRDMWTEWATGRPWERLTGGSTSRVRVLWLNGILEDYEVRVRRYHGHPPPHPPWPVDRLLTTARSSAGVGWSHTSYARSASRRRGVATTRAAVL